MAILYHHIEPNYYLDYGVTENPKLPNDISFTNGTIITDSLADPLVFEVNFPPKSEVPHFIGDTIPVFSDLLVRTLRSGGVDNFQVFPALLRNQESSFEWRGFWAVNVLGLAAAADLERSIGDTIMKGDPQGVRVPLVGFSSIVLDKGKTHDCLMFRLAESPSTLLIHDRIDKHIDANRPPNGWNFISTEVETV